MVLRMAKRMFTDTHTRRVGVGFSTEMKHMGICGVDMVASVFEFIRRNFPGASSPITPLQVLLLMRRIRCQSVSGMKAEGESCLAYRFDSGAGRCW